MATFHNAATSGTGTSPEIMDSGHDSNHFSSPPIAEQQSHQIPQHSDPEKAFETTETMDSKHHHDEATGHSTHDSDSPASENELPADEEKKPVNPMMDPSQFPDGGAKAWLTVAGASACMFVSFGWINCVGIFQNYYQTHQLRDFTPSEIAWIPSLQVFFMLFCGPFVGKVFDDYGPRYLLLAGMFLHTFGLMMTSISHKYYQILLSQAVVSAIGASCVFYPAFTCVSTWFFKKRGAALGLTTAGSSLGGVIFPIMLIHLIPEVGFGWAMRICAFLIFTLLLFANFAVRSRIEPSRRPFRLMAFVSPLKEAPFLLLTCAVFFFYWGMFVPFAFIVEEAISKGMSAYLAQYLVPILNAASLFGRTVPNAIADKVGRYNVMIVMSLLTSIVILAIWIPVTNNVGLIWFAVLFGIASGAGIGLTPVLVHSLSPIKDIGVRSGTVFAVGSIAALTGSPIGGQIINDSHYTFRNCQIFAGVSCFIGFSLFVATRVKVGGVKFAKI